MFFATKEKTIFDAHELYLYGKYDKALQLCEQLLAKNPDSYSAINLIANIYFIRENFSKGEQYLYKLKDLFIRNNDYEKAIAAVNRLLVIKPNQPKYLKEKADIYKLDSKDNLRVRQYLKIAYIYRRDGQFKKAAETYMEMSQTYSSNSKLDKIIINKLLMLGELDTLAHFANNRIINSDLTTQEEKDDAILVCVEAGCKPEFMISNINDFLKPNPERLSLVEDIIYKYFIKHKDDQMFKKIIDSVGYEKISYLIDKIRAEAPDTVIHLSTKPEPELEPEVVPEAIIDEPTVEEMPEAEEVLDVVSADETIIDEAVIETFASDTEEETSISSDIELDSHIVETTLEDTVVEQIELDVFDDGQPSSIGEVQLDGLEKFDADETSIEVPVLDGLQTYELETIEVEEPVKETSEQTEIVDEIDNFDPALDKNDDIFSAFDVGENTEKGDDPFAAFGDDIEDISVNTFDDLLQEQVDVPEPVEESIKEQASEDMFSELIPEEKTEIETKVEQIDMSDVTIKATDKEDIFADMVPDVDAEIIKKEPSKKIVIDADDIKPDEKSGKDIFDMEI